jgi:DNA processing protein
MPSSWTQRGKCGSSTPSETRVDAGWLRLLAAVAISHYSSVWLRALHSAGSADTLLGASHRSRRAFGLTAEQASLLDAPESEPPAAWQAWLDTPGHALIVLDSAAYPPLLREIPDPPLALWVIGTAYDLLQDPQLAMVGSRHPSRNGRVIAESFAAQLSLCGLTITSGLARGIDAASHTGALAESGHTLAVLGNGIDRIYPPRNQSLAEQIGSRGLIVSEYAPGTPVRPLQFPRRNRIIAGMSLGTLVVEATRRSGSLITARLALEFGREVFAVPGSIHAALSKGCHKLIRSGAKLVEETADILIEIAPQLRAAAAAETHAPRAVIAGELPAPLAQCLDFSPITFDALLSESGLTAAELSSMLLHLELQGKIEALPGGRYCRLAKRA